MPIDLSRLTLGIDTRLIDAKSLNYRLPSWPPPFDFPVVIDAKGSVISRFGDDRWDLSCWHNKKLVVNFGDGAQRKNASTISKENADILRQIAAWMLWGPRNVRLASTLVNQIKIIRPLFVLCSEENITADSLERFPSVGDQLSTLIRSVNVDEFLRLFHILYEQRDLLGFTLLTPNALRRLTSSFPQHTKRQTAYIPPRIWMYQVTQLRKFLDDFLAHREAIEACYSFCIDAYINNFGSLANARQMRQIGRSKSNPFITSDFRRGTLLAARSYGAFSETAKRFGIEDLLLKWCPTSKRGLMINTLSRYLRMVVEVGCAYLLNFSLMRIDECWMLRCNCYESEEDETFGTIYLLRGATRKTVADADALWITSPSANIAVESMASVAHLRIRYLASDTDFEIDEREIQNPYLALSTSEPWIAKSWRSNFLSKRHNYPNYLVMVRDSPKLFDVNELRITEDDLRIARLVTPDLDDDTFRVGEIWPLAWHQLRRTGAVNMQASGLVSDPSIQYQLKHATRAMALYYGQGFSHVRLNETARAEYVRTMYEIQGIEIAHLFADRYVSPYGSKHKAEILTLVSEKDNKILTAAARKGEISWRETLLGGCTKRGPCTYGGIDNIVRCGGGDERSPCVHALYDQHKIGSMIQLKRTIASRLATAQKDSPYAESLMAQQRALENALHAIKK